MAGGATTSPDFVWDLVKSKYASAVFTYRFALIFANVPPFNVLEADGVFQETALLRR